MKFQIIFALCLLKVAVSQIPDNDIEENSSGWYQIEGKVYPPEIGIEENWQEDTQIIVNGGEIKGFLRTDGTFIISKIPSGSYVVDIVNPNYLYEPVRVEINNKGKFRARKVNNVQLSQVLQVPYPLKLKALTTFRYFQQREQWRISDFIFSPMVLMMILPLLLLVLLPKIMSDPETKKEMENLQLPKLGGDMPDMSEMISKFLGGGSSTPKPSTSAASVGGKAKKRN